MLWPKIMADGTVGVHQEPHPETRGILSSLWAMRDQAIIFDIQAISDALDSMRGTPSGTIDFAALERVRSPYALAAYNFSYLDYQHCILVVQDDEPDEDGGLIQGQFIFGGYSQEPATLIASAITPVDPTGKLMLDRARVEPLHPAYTEQMLAELIYHTAWAMMLLSCRNIEAVPHTVAETRQARRARERAGTPKLTYYTLEVSGKEAGGQATGMGVKGKALHLVRGHFAEYSEDAPRFGRAKDGVGRFWIPAHARGSLDHGAVIKDYRIT
jgi:hypothetical protein